MKKLSKYNIWLESNGDSSLCFNAISGGFVEMELEAFSFLNSISKGEIDESDFNDSQNAWYKEFLRGNLLVDDCLDECERLKYGFRKNTFSTDKLSLTILPTLSCNCDCVYCFENKKNSMMSDEVVSKIKDKVKYEVEKNKVKFVGVTWFGGEPLIGIDIIRDISKYIIDECENAKIDYYSSVITNGLLLTEEMCKELSDLKVKNLQITIDGPKKIHDSRRVLKNGAGTFDKIIEKILIASKYIHVNVRVNIDEKISYNLDELFSDLNPIVGKKNVSIYPAQLQDEMTSACASVETSCFELEEFAKHSKKFIQRSHQEGFPLYWRPSPRNSCCCATSISAIVIQPNGDLCLCWNQVGLEDESFGKILNYKDTFVAKNFYKWRLHDPFEIEECVECQFLPLCMGGCPAMRVIPTSDFMYRKGEGRCTELRYNLKDMLEYVYKTSKAEREKNKKKETIKAS